MEAKYYRPDITEFHIGFEYEIYNDDDNVWEKKVFPNDFICTGTDEEPDLVELFYSNLKEARVKYLDRGDVESLGLKFVKQYPALNELVFIIEFKDEAFELSYDLDTHYLRIAYDSEGDVTLFAGTINNKSELKRLLKQIGIIE